MKFEVSEKIISKVNKAIILDSLEEQFRKTSQSVVKSGEYLEAISIEASFGSINRSDNSIIKINGIENGYLLIAEVNYRPSVVFWIFIIIGLFTYIFWLLPIVFYLLQKQTVRENIENIFRRIKNEYGETDKEKTNSVANSDFEQLEKLAALKEKGIITEEEFQAKKKGILKI